MAAKKKKASKKSKPEVSESGEPAGHVVKRFLKAYEDACVKSGSLVSPLLKSAARKCAEDERFLTKVILETLPATSDPAAPLLLTALAEAMRDSRYVYIRELYVWGVVMDTDPLVALAHLFERGCYPFRALELLDCLVDAHGVGRLCRSIRVDGTLTSLTLDYNEFGDDGCRGLCAGLRSNATLLKLSLCYCSLTEKSGGLLGSLVSSTAIREIFLDGNDLGCQGTQALIAACAAHAEREMSLALQKKALLAYERQSGLGFRARSAGSGSGGGSQPTGLDDADGGKASAPGSAAGDRKTTKKGGRRKKRSASSAKSSAPPVGPWLSKLHIADNGIDACDKDGGHVAPLICMRLVRRLLANSASLEELDLEDNLIGDLGGRELLCALKERSEVNGLPGVRLRTTHRMQAETFRGLCKLGGGGSVKKKKRKGKKKKT